MFPPNDNDWIVYMPAATPNNVFPCWVDLVGDASAPATYYYLSPTPDPNPTEVAFRMRLNGSPLSLNPSVYQLKEFVWGVEIRDSTNAVLYTVLVNASGATYRLQVKDVSSTLIYNVPIALNNPTLPSDNVRVVNAGVHFPCASPVMPDEDYFLDFTLPTSYFPSLNFVSSTYRMCYFTSTQDVTINKDRVCGPIINPPVDEPVLCVTKRIMAGPSSVCADDRNTWLLLITLYNCGTVPVTEVLLTDTLTGSIVLDATPTFIPNEGISYDALSRIATWDVGTIGVGESVSLVITLTGHFPASGHYILDAGVVTATDLDPVDFADRGILVFDQSQLTAQKVIVSGPSSVEQCQIATWTLQITVTNVGDSDIANIAVVDQFNSQFTIESGPQLTPSMGYASVSGNEITWNIDVLAANSSATLLITVTGFFCCALGHAVFDTGSLLDPCMQTVSFADPGIDVVSRSIPGEITVDGDLINCKTGALLSGVAATVYNSNCKVIQTAVFDEHFSLSLAAGTYTVLFEKDGYSRKFLSLVLQSDWEITVDVNLSPKAVIVVQADAPANETLDLYASIVCEKIDAEVVYSSFVCVNSAAEVESLGDVIDSYSCTVLCNSKLRSVLQLEKNLIYKLGGEKQLKYDVRTVPICYPLAQGDACTDYQCTWQVKDVFHCKEQNLVYNIAHLGFVAYLLQHNDVLLNGVALDEC